MLPCYSPPAAAASPAWSLTVHHDYVFTLHPGVVCTSIQAHEQQYTQVILSRARAGGRRARETERHDRACSRMVWRTSASCVAPSSTSASACRARSVASRAAARAASSRARADAAAASAVASNPDIRSASASARDRACWSADARPCRTEEVGARAGAHACTHRSGLWAHTHRGA